MKLFELETPEPETERYRQVMQQAVAGAYALGRERKPLPADILDLHPYMSYPRLRRDARRRNRVLQQAWTRGYLRSYLDQPLRFRRIRR